MRNQGLRALTWAGVLALGMLPIPAHADQLSGFIHSVDPDAKRIVVTVPGTDQKIDLTVNDRTLFMTTAGQPLRFKDLKKGDGIGVAYWDGVAASMYVNQSVLRGVVETIDLDGKSITVSESGTDRDVKIPIPDEATIQTMGGKVLDFKKLRTGDGVGVVYAGRNPAKIIVNPRPDELKGHIESIAADEKSFVVKEVGTDANVSVAVNSKTSIVTTKGKTLELKDLKKGDGVGIAHDSSLASKIVVYPAPVR